MRSTTPILEALLNVELVYICEGPVYVQTENDNDDGTHLVMSGSWVIPLGVMVL